MIGELLIWLSTHRDVKVRCNYDPIFNAYKIRVVKGRYISEYMVTEDECEIILKNGKDATKLIISILNHLYDEIEKEKKKYASEV